MKNTIRVRQKYFFNKNKIFVVHGIKNGNVFGCLIKKEFINESFVIPETWLNIPLEAFNLKIFKNYRDYSQ